MIIRPATKKDIPQILSLFQKVASNPGYLARLENEIDLNYVEHNVCTALDTGCCLIAVDDIEDKPIAVIHGSCPGISCFQHVIGNITIAVLPEHQSNGIGKQLFCEFITQIKTQRNNISRIELYTRESNTKGINLYKSLGFQIEGKLRNRVNNLDGTKEDDLIMGLIL